MSELVTIEATRREGKGKSYTRKLRSRGLVPGNIIGEKNTSTMIEMDPKMLPKAWANNRQFNLSFEGKTQLVKIQELQIGARKRNVIHVDLMNV